MKKAIFSRFFLKKILKTDTLGKEIFYFKNIHSTNKFLKELPQKFHGAVCISESQTEGRGRLGREFLSRKGGLYMSVLYKAQKDFDAGVITSLAAVAVSRSIDQIYRVQTGIKWVNDIHLENKKICGILCEKIDDFVVVGIGVNVQGKAFPEDLKNIADNLYNLTGKKAKIQRVAAVILGDLEAVLREENLKNHIEILREKSVVLGKEILVLKQGESYCAKAIDILENGSLLIEKEGEKEILNFGEISLKI